MSSETKQLEIRAQLDEINRIESFVESFCLKNRIYDEYFGIIIHSLSEIVRKIIKQNNAEGYIRITQYHEKNKVRYKIESPDGLDLDLDFDDKNPTDLALNKLIDDYEVEDSQIIITYNIKSIHYTEWIRRKNLLHEYEQKTTKKAK